MVVMWLALSLHGRRVSGLTPGWVLPGDVCMFFPCMYGFSLGPPAFSQHPKPCMLGHLVILNRPME